MEPTLSNVPRGRQPLWAISIRIDGGGLENDTAGFSTLANFSVTRPSRQIGAPKNVERPN
jgi:hypothetical protein